MVKKIVFLFCIICFHSFAGTSDEIRKQIEKILSELPPSTKIAVLIIKPLTQDTIFKLNPAESMIPASNTKLFTTAAALTNLGGDFSLSTKIFSDDNDFVDNVINGNLYIKGYGNSLFTSSDLDSLPMVCRIVRRESVR